MVTELEQRAAVIAEARSWLHTPWRHCANVKGAQGAVDCAMFLASTFINAGILAPFDPRPYPTDWFLHHDEERFLVWVVDKFGGVEIPLAKAQPGDLLAYQVGRCYSHAGLLVETQLLIHAHADQGKVTYTETFDITLAKRRPRAFDMFARARA